jgi:hypothetical protein
MAAMPGKRIMGSGHGLAPVHNAHEPAGTFNVQRSTFNVQRSTFNGKPSIPHPSTGSWEAPVLS